VQTRRLISRFFAAAFVIVVLQQIAAAPAVRTAAGAAQRALQTAVSRHCTDVVEPEKISQTWSISSLGIGPPSLKPSFGPEWFFSIYRFQRPPPSV
jgi:hypothetical protein